MSRAPDITLVLGGSRSGKSEYAERLAAPRGPVTYVATADPLDNETIARIRAHRERRPVEWPTVVAAGTGLAGAVESALTNTVLVDSMTMYAARLLELCADPREEVLSLIRDLEATDRSIIIVSDEVGMGVVPASAEGRRFRDFLGWVNQVLAEAADNVYLVVAGVPVPVKVAAP